MEHAVANIKAELEQRLAVLRNENKLLEAQRLERRTNYDIEMMLEMGYTSGIENYSRRIWTPDVKKANRLIRYWFLSWRDFFDAWLTNRT